MVSAIAMRISQFESNLKRYERSVFELGVNFQPTKIQKQMFALINSIYPQAELGQTVLDGNVYPEYVDSIVNECTDLLSLNAQHLSRRAVGIHSWMVSGRSSSPGPSMLAFHSLNSSDSWAGKPTNSSLFTSVATQHDLGMWYLYVVSREHIFTRPWFAWNLTFEENTEQLIIDSAVDWCSFVHRFPHQGLSGVVPDWETAAMKYDAVHITPKAVAAIDCLEFDFHGEVIEASYWSVETTVWLRWRVNAVSQVTLPAELTL